MNGYIRTKVIHLEKAGTMTGTSANINLTISAK